MSSSHSKKAAALLRKLTGNMVFGRRLPNTFGGAKVYITPACDIRLLSSSLGSSRRELLAVANRFVGAGDTVWDIGANLGVFSFSAAYKAGSAGHIYSVEADTRHAELMYRTRRGLSERYAGVTILCAAVSDTLSCLNLNVVTRGTAKNYVEGSVGSDQAGDVIEKKTVVSVTGDWLLRFWPPPSFLKIDIEGAELSFLKGAEKLFATCRPATYIEISAQNQSDVTQFFKHADYALYRLSSSQQLEPIDKCAFNTVAIPRESMRGR
jgi:FkbM family methyltransferase